MARALAVLGERLERLVDERRVVLVDVETEEANFARRRAAHAIEEHERLGDQIVSVLVGLNAQEILINKIRHSFGHI